MKIPPESAPKGFIGVLDRKGMKIIHLLGYHCVLDKKTSPYENSFLKDL